MNTRLKRVCAYDEDTFTLVRLQNDDPGSSPLLSVYLLFLLSHLNYLTTPSPGTVGGCDYCSLPDKRS